MQPVGELLCAWLPVGLVHAQGAGDGGQDERRVVDCSQRHEARAVFEMGVERPPGQSRELGLANPRRANQRQQAHPGRLKLLAQLRQLWVATHQRPAWRTPPPRRRTRERVRARLHSAWPPPTAPPTNYRTPVTACLPPRQPAALVLDAELEERAVVDHE